MNDLKQKLRMYLAPNELQSEILQYIAKLEERVFNLEENTKADRMGSSFSQDEITNAGAWRQ